MSEMFLDISQCHDDSINIFSPWHWETTNHNLEREVVITFGGVVVHREKYEPDGWPWYAAREAAILATENLGLKLARLLGVDS